MNITTTKDNFSDEQINEDVKIIRKPSIARKILKLGGDSVRIVDIKASKDNPERSVFCFKNDEAFQKVFAEVIKSNRAERDAERADEIERIVAAREADRADEIERMIEERVNALIKERLKDVED